MRDVVTSGTRAYVLTELPNEVRVVDISDPAHPSVLVSHATEGSQPPRAIAFANNTVYVLGEKLYAYSPTDLSKTGEQLTSYVTDPASGLTYVDQHLRADGACIALTGRQFAPQFLSGSPRSPRPRPDASSPRSPARSTSSPTTRSRSGRPSRCRRRRATAQRGS